MSSLLGNEENGGYFMRPYVDFPANIKDCVYHIYPRKKRICVNGFKYFDLVELKKIDLNTRLSFPPDVFATINKSK